MTSPERMAPDAPAAPADKASVWEDFLDIVYAPAAVFRRRATGNYWIPLLVVAVLMEVLAYANRGIMRPVFDAEFARGAAAAMKANPQLTPDMMNRARDIQFAIAQYGTGVVTVLLILFVAFIIWLGVRLVGSRVSWNAALVVASFAQIPKVVQQIALSIQALLIDPANVTSRFSIEIGPGRFMDAATVQPMVGALMDRLEIFALWSVVLVTIGAAVSAKMPRAKAWAFGIGIWVVGALPGIYGAWKAM